MEDTNLVKRIKKPLTCLACVQAARLVQLGRTPVGQVKINKLYIIQKAKPSMIVSHGNRESSIGEWGKKYFHVKASIEIRVKPIRPKPENKGIEIEEIAVCSRRPGYVYPISPCNQKKTARGYITCQCLQTPTRILEE